MTGTWTTNDGRYEFKFTVTQGGDYGYQVSVELDYVALSGIHMFLWQGDLIPNNAEVWLQNLPSHDDYSAKGWIRLSIKDQEDGPTLVIFAEIVFTHLQHKNDFQGPIFVRNLRIFPPSPDPQPEPFPPPISDPDPIPDPVPAPNSNPLIIRPDEHDDLFPYIFMHSWPRLSEEELAYSFAEYTPYLASPPRPDLYRKLISLNKAGDVAGIDREVDLFLEAEPPYLQARLYPGELMGPIKWFDTIYHELQLLDTPSKEGILTLAESYIPSLSGTDFPVTLSQYLSSQEYLEQKEAVWQTYFALVIRLGYEFLWLDQLSKTLLCCHILETLVIPSSPPEPYLASELFWDLIHCSILLPEELFPLHSHPSSPPSNNNGEAVTPYAIGDLHQVQQSFVRYQKGEIAQVINVMPGEKKEVVSRKLKSTQLIEQESSSRNEKTEEQSDESISNFESEVWESLAQTDEVYDYQDLKNSYGPPTNITLNGKWSKQLTLTTPGQENLTDFAKEVLTKTSRKVAQRIRKFRQSNALNEDEETITSTFDNIGNIRPICGAYRWLNKVYNAQVVKYGERLMLSFWLSQPAASFIQKTTQQLGENLIKPLTPAEMGVHSFRDISRENYVNLTAYYQIREFALPPAASQIVSETLVGAQSKLIEIPEGYEAEEAYVTYIFPESGNLKSIEGVIGRKSFVFNHPMSLSQAIPLSQENTSVPVSVSNTASLGSPPEIEPEVQISVEITALCTPLLLDRWRVELFNLISASYQKLSTQYHAQLAQQTEQASKVANPLRNKKVIREELRKGCMNILLEQLSSLHPQPASPPDAASPVPRLYEFVTNAFEWEEMTFYFQEDYSRVETGGSLFSNDDHLFTAFVQAQSAQIIVPVRRPDSYRMLYFLQTGDIWIGQDNLVPALRENVEMIHQLTKTLAVVQEVPEVLESWEILIPTTLQILQMEQAWEDQTEDITTNLNQES